MRTIYGLYEDLDDKDYGLRVTDIAKKMKISKSSVSEMLSKLSDLKYIHWEKYGKIFLTKKGLEYSKKVMYVHRIIEVFLVDVLGVDISQAHEEAHRLEHAFCFETIQKLGNFLNHPKISPFEKQIPLINKKR